MGRYRPAALPPLPSLGSRGANTLGVKIRAAIAADVGRLAELNSFVQEMHNEIAPDWFKPSDLGATEAYFRELLDTEAALLHVVEFDDVVAGYVLARVHHIPETVLTFGGLAVELDEISVDPSLRGRGLGRALIERVKTLAAELRAARLVLTVWEFNGRAQTVFAAAGFEGRMRRMSLRP